MKRDERLVRLSWDHHHALVMARRIGAELPAAGDAALAELYGDLLRFWAAGLLPHFRLENECLLARLIRSLPPGHEAVRRTQDDHLHLEALVATMRDVSDVTERKEALLRFGEQLRAHVRWEEDVLFNLTQASLTGAEMDALARDIEEQLPPLEAAPL